MEIHKFTGVEFGLLQNLNFSDVNVVKRIDVHAFLLDVFTDTVWDQFVDERFQVLGRGFFGHDVDHLLSDSSDLRTFGVGSFLDLLADPLGESKTEHSEKISVSGFDIDVSLDQSLPLSDERAELVSGQVHTVEVGVTVLALDILADQLELPEGVFVVVKISESTLVHSALEGV